ncbi:MAG: GTPase HflX [Deltaproteobacteria bacterium]|nr:GTPase HflX [Deltaproteobacteria bacterium]
MNEIFGNTLGLKSSHMQRLQNTYRRRVGTGEVVTAELARHLTELSKETKRQVGVLISRKGEIEHVIVGNAHKLELPDIGRARAGQARLRGLRLVHTHLHDEPLTKDDLTDLALLRLDVVAAINVLDDGLPGALHVGHLVPEGDGGSLWTTETFRDVYGDQPHVPELCASLEDEFARKVSAKRVRGQTTAILVSVGLGDRYSAEWSQSELRELARTAGLTVLDEVLQMRREVDPRYLIGRGKLDDLVLRSMQLMADMIVFDKNLSPSQARHIADVTSLKILDRTQLILDIFAQRAQSAEGKLQVELAQLRYLLPRLAGSDDSLSRLAGGIGGRGPGETKLEIDRRRVRERINSLERKIDQLGNDRAVRRSKRNREGLPIISIVGYTNAGKSTLLNRLTKSSVLAENALFATLDPTSRRLRFPREREVIITDTVGFIRDLPPDLVTAFRATLDELADADLLLHVIDAADPDQQNQTHAVERILGELNLMEKPRLKVFNKADALPPMQAENLARVSNGVAISATSGEGLQELLARAERVLWSEGKVAELPRPASAAPEAEHDVA